jgi:hypothetical protein
MQMLKNISSSWSWEYMSEFRQQSLLHSLHYTSALNEYTYRDIMKHAGKMYKDLPS